MAFQASHRNARISARKVRLMIDLVRGKYADEAVQPRAGVADVRARAQRRAAFDAGDGERTAHRLRDHVETQILGIGTVGREALDPRNGVRNEVLVS